MRFDETEIMLAIDALDAGRLDLFVTQAGEARIGISINAEIKSGSVLKSVCGYGEDMKDALYDLWRQLTEMEDSSEYVVVNAGRENRKAVRWNRVAFKSVYEG